MIFIPVILVLFYSVSLILKIQKHFERVVHGNSVVCTSNQFVDCSQTSENHQPRIAASDQPPEYDPKSMAPPPAYDHLFKEN